LYESVRARYLCQRILVALPPARVPHSAGRVEKREAILVAAERKLEDAKVSVYLHD
jgi:hypothetical protein